MVMEDPENQRGRDVTRPLTVQPPEKTEYRRDEVMTFGLSLMGKARSIMPYLVRAIEWMGKAGLGRYRGQFKLMSVHEFSPLFDVERLLMDGTTVQTPTLAVTPSHIREIAHTLPTDKITLQFRTPTRLTAEGKLVKQATPTVMMNRLLERCQNLVTHYAETDDIPNNDTWKLNAIRMTELAQQLRIAYSELEWVDVFSGSKRQGRMTPISGFVGIVRWEGDISSLREWLLWGQSLHVGKDAVKGNGYYRVMN